MVTQLLASADLRPSTSTSAPPSASEECVRSADGIVGDKTSNLQQVVSGNLLPVGCWKAIS